LSRCSTRPRSALGCQEKDGTLTIARGEGPAGPAIAITGKSGLEPMEAILR
jgi:hypothetical protein